MRVCVLNTNISWCACSLSRTDTPTYSLALSCSFSQTLFLSSAIKTTAEVCASQIHTSCHRTFVSFVYVCVCVCVHERNNTRQLQQLVRFFRVCVCMCVCSRTQQYTQVAAAHSFLSCMCVCSRTQQYRPFAAANSYLSCMCVYVCVFMNATIHAVCCSSFVSFMYVCVNQSIYSTSYTNSF